VSRSPFKPGPLDRGDKLALGICYGSAALCLLILGVLAFLPGCSIRGGPCSSDDSCTTGEVCVRRRCEGYRVNRTPQRPSADLRVPVPVPGGGGPL
jgi:hypothetical protein